MKTKNASAWTQIPATELAALTRKAADYEDALRRIAAGMGNLSLEMMGPEGVSGPNDGKARAIYLEQHVKLARETLAKNS